MCASTETDVRESASDCTLASGEGLVSREETSHPMSLKRPCPQPGNGLYLAMRTSHEALIMQFFQPPVTSSLFGPNILLITLFSNTLGPCSSLNVRDQVSHPYRTTGKIVVLYVYSNFYVFKQQTRRKGSKHYLNLDLRNDWSLTVSRGKHDASHGWWQCTWCSTDYS
jgi:hypothetical protein